MREAIERECTKPWVVGGCKEYNTASSKDEQDIGIYNRERSPIEALLIADRIPGGGVAAGYPG